MSDTMCPLQIFLSFSLQSFEAAFCFHLANEKSKVLKELSPFQKITQPVIIKQGMAPRPVYF